MGDMADYQIDQGVSDDEWCPDCGESLPCMCDDYYAEESRDEDTDDYYAEESRDEDTDD